MFYNYNGTNLEISMRNMPGNSPNVYNFSNTSKQPMKKTERKLKNILH